MSEITLFRLQHTVSHGSFLLRDGRVNCPHPDCGKAFSKEFGDYRTKKMILHAYDKMQEAIETGTAYQTILSLPPSDPSVAYAVRDVSATSGV